MTETTTAVPLDPEHLVELDVPVPGYDRSAVTAGIVHFGVGGFHRAHQAMYLDQLMERGLALEWGICGVGVMAFDARMRDAMRAQDGLFTLVLKDADGSWTPRVVGSIVEYLYAPDDPDAVIEKMASPSTRIVSLTVTEGGYNISAVTGEFDTTNAAVQADVVPGAVPATVFGLVTEALVRRRDRGLEPFTIMSCDNIPGNGEMARDVFGTFADLREPGLGEWVRENVRFPSSMVDRITPVTTDEDRAEVARRFGIADAWPVVCEPFTQWVLEDHFGPGGRPPLEEVGVQLVPDVEPYELMKLRLLNGGHQALAYVGYLAGFRLAHEVAQDPLLARWLRAWMDEATPTVPPVPGIDLEAYKTQLIERFSNAGVRDTVARLCAESSDRIPKWVLPVVRLNLAAGRPVTMGATMVAAWARYAEGTDEQGEPIQVVDRLADELTALARQQRDEPLAFLGRRDLFGDLVDEPAFTDVYAAQLASLHEVGARATIEKLLGPA